MILLWNVTWTCFWWHLHAFRVKSTYHCYHSHICLSKEMLSGYRLVKRHLTLIESTVRNKCTALILWILLRRIMLQCTFFKWTEFHVDVNKFHSPEPYLETRLVPFKHPLGNVLNTLATIAMPWHCGVGVLHMQTPLTFFRKYKSSLVYYQIMSNHVLMAKSL